MNLVANYLANSAADPLLISGEILSIDERSRTLSRASDMVHCCTDNSYVPGR